MSTATTTSTETQHRISTLFDAIVFRHFIIMCFKSKQTLSTDSQKWPQMIFCSQNCTASHTAMYRWSTLVVLLRDSKRIYYAQQYV